MPDINLEVEQKTDMELDVDRTENLMLDSGVAVVVGGGRDYDKLKNKPLINGTEVSGVKTMEDFGENTISYEEIRKSVDNAVQIIFGG